MTRPSRKKPRRTAAKPARRLAAPERARRRGGAPAPAPRRPARGPAPVPAEGPLTQAQYARHRAVSREAVRKAVRDRRIFLNRDGLIDREAADAAWRANTDPGKPSSTAMRTPGEPIVHGPAAPPAPAALEAAASGADSLPEGMTYADARALKEWNQAMTLDLKRRLLEGKLVEVEKVEDAAFRAARTARDTLMAIPDRLDAELAAISDAAEVHRRLAEEIRHVCDELARGMRQDPDAEEPAA